MSLPPDLSRPIAATRRRIRAQRAIDAAALFALVGLGLAGLVLAAVKTEALTSESALPWLVVAAAPPLLGALLGALRPVHRLLPAKLLDRSHGLRDRLTNAVELDAVPQRTPFMDAAIEDASAHAKRGLVPARAMPLRAPVELVGVLGLAIGVTALGLLEVPRIIEERITRGGIDPVRMHADDIDAFESELRDLLDDPDTADPVRDAARELNRLIEDLADERLDRAETLRRLQELEERIAETRPGSPDLMRESLEQLGQDLRRAELAEELSAALREGDAERAESEMRSLAERLRQDEANRAQLEQLRRALAQAAENQPEDRQEELARREEEMQRLLQRQREKQSQTPQERRLLQRRQRELERLRREHQEAQERGRQLERLQREMNRAAEDLHRDQQEQAADDLERSAEDLNRMAQQQLSEEQMRQLQQQLSELRELIRQQRQRQGQQGQQGQRGQGGQGQSQMDRFVLRARGQGHGEGMRIGRPGQQGQQGQQGQPGGQPGEGQGQGEGQGPGEGQPMLTLGGSGEQNAVLEIPGMGQGQQQGGQGQGGQAQLGPGAGTGHDDAMLDDPTRLGGTRQNVRVEGEQRDGPSRSEVIQSSAQRGFANREYRDVYTDYSGHAEEVLERDEIPQGYRSYVRRYFQLIRPRDAQ